MCRIPAPCLDKNVAEGSLVFTHCLQIYHVLKGEGKKHNIYFPKNLSLNVQFEGMKMGDSR